MRQGRLRRAAGELSSVRQGWLKENVEGGGAHFNGASRRLRVLPYNPKSRRGDFSLLGVNFRNCSENFVLHQLFSCKIKKIK